MRLAAKLAAKFNRQLTIYRQIFNANTGNAIKNFDAGG